MSTISFEDKDAPALKKWLVTRLEDISDADSDVLADYVLALVKSDEPDDQTRANCIENLEDFLKEHTQKFVDDVFTTIRIKSYLPGYVPPKPAAPSAPFQASPGPSTSVVKGRQAVNSASPGSRAASSPFAPPAGPSNANYARPQNLNGNASGRGDQSRKRSWNDHESSDQHPTSSMGERAIKQMRRGGPNMRGGRGGGTPNGNSFQGGGAPNGSPFHPPPMPTPPPGFPPLDPTNPMAAIMAMQAMGMPPMPDFGQFAVPPALQGHGRAQQQPRKINQRCRDYDTKGFCAAGSECPYEHGDDHIVMGQSSNEPEDLSLQYNPNFPLQQELQPNSRAPNRGNRGGRGRGGATGNRRGRASFSSAAPNHDTRITSIVVEQIPEEKFDTEEVRSFFQEFGTVVDVNMQAYKRLAIVKFADYTSAKKAYDSPKVIFDNRFVKVYWYKPDAGQNGHQPAGGKRGAAVEAMQEDEEMIDPEEFAKKQAEAQRAHDEKAKKLKEAESAKEELDKRIKAQAEERRKLIEKLASKTDQSAAASPGMAGSPATQGANDKSPTPGAVGGAKTTPQTAKEKATEALRAKLAELEAEAETLGLAPEDPNAPSYSSPHAPPYGRGRGGYRGGYRGYDPSFRGGGRGGGRGGWRGAYAGGAVARLDNRPKSISVTALEDGVDFADESVGEALRTHLYTIGSFASIQPPPADFTPPTQPDENAAAAAAKSTTIVSFHERYVAEIFIASAKPTNGAIPGIGKVDLQWVPNGVLPAPTASSPTASGPAAASAGAPAEAAKTAAPTAAAMPEAPASSDVAMSGDGAEGGDVVDYDVADEEDEGRWMEA